MISNQIEINGRQRRIVVNNNEVIIFYYRQKNVPKTRMEVKREKFRILTIFSIGERKLVQCISAKGEVVFYSINQCCKITSAPVRSKIEFFYVAGEVLIKVTDDEKQSLYDESGNLIATETEYDVTPKFSGCDVVIEKVDKSTQKIYTSNLEGCPC
ncbi:MAG: hypothetical protein J6A04_05090 [Clostridia bacterium]|nr:hypothetical protein [Clostridia bacterium]